MNRTFSSSTTSPGATTTPSSQSRFNGAGTPSSSVRRRETGARVNSSANLPSSGRPRCDISITRAFAAKAAWMVGSAARIRASLATSPSLMGTFRSSRIRTRLPARSKLVIFMIFMRGSLFPWVGSGGWAQAAFDQAVSVSSMRFEKPHSLSYHEHTLTSVPSITLVSVAS